VIVSVVTRFKRKKVFILIESSVIASIVETCPIMALSIPSPLVLPAETSSSVGTFTHDALLGVGQLEFEDIFDQEGKAVHIGYLIWEDGLEVVKCLERHLTIPSDNLMMLDECYISHPAFSG
jgi:hypothetical protein